MKPLFLTLVFLSAPLLWSQKPIFTQAKIKAATVYATGAELHQNTSVSLPKGTSEIVVKNVADFINESSIQINAPKHLTVLSVQFTKNYISEYETDETQPEIKRVRDSISWISKEITTVQNQKNAFTKTIELLDKNQQLAGANAALNVAELMKLVDYYSKKRSDLSNTVSTFIKKENELNKQLKRLNAQLEVNEQKGDKISQGKLILQVMNELAGSTELEINYLTAGASWKPFYELRATSINHPIEMVYKGQVVQNTGIDWKKIKLTLSSGNPSQNNEAPLLQAWFLRFGIPQLYQKNNLALNSIQKADYKSFDKKTGERLKEKQEFEIDDSGISDFTTVSENQLNISFDITIPYDILSNGKAHSVALKEINLPATFKYYSVPKIEKEAFLLAEVNDYSKYNLLPGEANIIFEDTYVGKTFINANATSDTLNLSLGRDKKIAIKREKVVDKSGTKFLSSFKEQIFTYDLTVRNNKKESIHMILKDQYPVSTDKDIIIELLEKDKAVANEETGVLTWKVDLKPNETKKYRISYKVRYPKNKIIHNL